MKRLFSHMKRELLAHNLHFTFSQLHFQYFQKYLHNKNPVILDLRYHLRVIWKVHYVYINIFMLSSNTMWDLVHVEDLKVKLAYLMSHIPPM